MMDVPFLPKSDDEAKAAYGYVHNLLKREAEDSADGKTRGQQSVYQTEHIATLVMNHKNNFFDRWFDKRTMESLQCPCCQANAELQKLPLKDRKEKIRINIKKDIEEDLENEVQLAIEEMPMFPPTAVRESVEYGILIALIRPGDLYL